MATEDRAPSDEQLAALAQQAPEGDTRAFEELVRRHERRVLTNCRYITRRPEESEDLAQEVFVKAFFRIGQFERRATFRTWLQRIKVNHCLNFLRRRDERAAADVDDPALANEPGLAHEPEADAAMRQRDRRRLIGRVLDEMADTLRIPLLMRDMDELSYEEIAAELGLGLSAAKMRVKRAREEFRRRFAELERTASAPRGAGGP